MNSRIHNTIERSLDSLLVACLVAVPFGFWQMGELLWMAIKSIRITFAAE